MLAMVIPSDAEVPEGGAPQPALCLPLPADPKALEETARQDTAPLAGLMLTCFLITHLPSYLIVA